MLTDVLKKITLNVAHVSNYPFHNVLKSDSLMNIWCYILCKSFF